MGKSATRNLYMMNLISPFSRGTPASGRSPTTSRETRHVRRTVFLGLLLGVSYALTAHAQTGPDNDANGAPGYTKSIFDHGQIDSVNLYNGQLTIPLALGSSYPVGPKLRVQVTMSYNSRATDYGSPTSQNSDFTYQPLAGNPSLGIGWELTLGAIKYCKHGNISGNCYFGPDGSQHMFDLGSTTGDGSQLFLAGSGPYDMWDGDGNHYVFGWQVSGYDEIGLPEGYTHDFGRGRDGWYVTSVTDPFLNGYGVSYYSRAEVSTPLWTYGTSSCSLPAYTASIPMHNPTAINTWIPKNITLPSARQVHFNTGTVNGIAGMITSVDFPEFVGGALATSTWTLVYDTFYALNHFCGHWNPPNPPPVLPVNLQRLKALQLPSDLQGSPSYQFSQTDLLTAITLPTGGTISYCYGAYTLYHARQGALEPGCQALRPGSDAVVEETVRCAVSGGVPSTPQPKIPGGCTDNTPERYKDNPTGVLHRRETLGSTHNDTDYVQYGFPFGERGNVTSPQPSQSLTVVVSPPSDENGGTGRRRAKAVLFDTSTSTIISPNPLPLSVPGDRVGQDIEERTFETDPTLGSLADPPCSGNPATDSDFCGSKSVRVTQKAYEYDTTGVVHGNRRVISEKRTHGASSCGSCPYHQVDFTLEPGKTWEGNGRHYDKETHSGNPVAPLGADDRTITTTWTPSNWPTSSGGTVLPNLFAKRIEHDSTLDVNRYFYFDSSNGFLKGSAIWESTVSPTRLFLTCQYQDMTSPNGTVHNQVTLMVLNQPEPTSNVCFGSISNWTTIGTSQDLFARQFSYQNGLLTSAQWMTSATTTANWFLKRYDRDNTTGWVTQAYDTAGVGTGYLYDSLGRPTCLEPSIPPGTLATTDCMHPPAGAEAAISVNYPTTTQTVATRDGGPGLVTSQEYDYDGLGRLIREVRRMPGLLQFAKRFYAYDPAGHQVFQSDWVASAASEILTFNSGASCAFSTGNFNTARPAAAPGTYSLCFDPFGRAQQVVGSNFSSLTTFDRTNGSTWYSDTREAVATHCIGGPPQDTCTAPGILSTTTNAKDAFGRLTSVMEPDGNTTSYTYDINNKLTHVFQGSHPRTFLYDAGGNLRQETTPERGQISYNDQPGVLAYGSLGNPLRETLADGVLRLRCYDFAGRLQLLRTSEDGSPNCTIGAGQAGRTYLQNSYDEFPSSVNLSSGKLTTSVGTSYQVLPSPPTTTLYGTVTDAWTYGGLGGRLSSQTTQVSASQSLTATQGWQYNSLGLLAHHSHPRYGTLSPFVVSLDYDAGLPATEYVNGIPMVTAVGYQPSGALASYTTGAGIQNVTTTITPDGSLPRPSNITTAGASANFLTGLYSYDGAGNILKMDPDPMDPTKADTFAYDSRSRLTGATLAGQGSQSFSYDQYGNMIAKAGPPWTVTFCSPTCVNNQLPSSAAQYDVRGNLILNQLDGGEIYTWDGLDRMSYNHSPINSSYVYDGANERVAKNSGPGWSFTFRDEQKRLTTEFAASGLPDLDNVYLGNQLVASYATGTTRAWAFYTADHLGTPRLLTDLTGNSFETRKYWPYGETYPFTSTGLEPIRFAGMERDIESGGRYYDHARSHEANLSRFLSPDRLGGRLSVPQTWNRYSYSLNNPLKLVDPDGLEVTYADKRLQAVFTRLAARSATVRDTLALYTGPGKPDLFIQRGDAGNDRSGEKATGVFKPDITPNYKRPDGSYTVSDEAGKDQFPATGKNLTGAELKSGTLTISSDTPPSSAAESNVAVHELGHADSAARDPLGYLQKGANDMELDPKTGQPLPHDDRPLEREANRYRERVCGTDKDCPR
jgi:RHS repeat-associated protein